MDNDSVSGGQMQYSCDSQLDFVDYWAEKTVEDAVLLGKQLRQEKPRPLPARECKLKKIDFIKPPCSPKNCGRRKSPKKTIHTIHSSRSVSPARREFSPSQSNKTPKRQKKRQKTKNKLTCGMRTAELAVPTKRQCLDTWRNKYNILPAFMIERLRQQVMDLRPVVQISDAIHCFKRKSCQEQRNSFESDPTSSFQFSKNKNAKNPIRMNEIKTMSAVFGHKIAKKLNVPINIRLNSDLQKVANVISYDIADLMWQSRTIDVNNRTNEIIHKEITDKITIWISDVLEESSYKIVEDQLRDFEEEAGPVLDFVDDLVDGVLDVCAPVPEVFEETSVNNEKCSSEDASVFDEETIDALPETDVYDNTNKLDYFQSTLITMVNDIDKNIDIKSYEYQDNDPEWQSSRDVDTKDTDMNVTYSEPKDAINTDVRTDGSRHHLELDDGIPLQTSENEIEGINTKYDKFQESEDTAVLDTDIIVNYENLEDGIQLQTSENVSEDTSIKYDEFQEFEDEKNYEYLESEDGVPLQTSEHKADDSNIKHDQFIVSEDDIAFQTSKDPEKQDIEMKIVENQPSDMVEITQETTDVINEAFADAADENIEPFEGSSDDNINKKVQFDGFVNDEQLLTEPKPDVENADWKASIDKMDFAAPNEDLLSDADESWPAEIQLPVVRPSQSVSKSITSLGNINEDEESLSILPIEKSSEIEKPAQGNIVEPLEEKTEEVEAQSTEDQPISTAENAEDFSPPQQESVLESSETPAPETTSEHGDQSDDKLAKEETASKDLRNTDAVAALEKEKNTFGNILCKSSSKKPPQIAKKKIPSKSPKASIEITRAPQSIPKAKIAGKRKTKTAKVTTKDIEETPGTSVKDLDCNDLEKTNYVKFSSLRIKPKPDYKVQADTAPAWITRTYGEPICICVNVDSKSKVKSNVMGGNDIRRWCRDLAKGYENLKMWNEWIDNTSKTVCMLQEEIGKIIGISALESPEGCHNKEWIKLKRNIDKDATLWKKLNHNTQERIKSYKNMYQKRSEIKRNYKITCACSDHLM